MTDLTTKVRQGLDEMRMLVLGIQLLIGFQFNAFFSQGFASLSAAAAHTLLAALFCLAAALAMVITPSAYNRIVERGRGGAGVLQVATRSAGIALLPFAAGLAGDVFIAMGSAAGLGWGLAVGGSMLVIALGAWYGIEWLQRDRRRERLEQMRDDHPQPTELKDRITLVMTEARVVLPGTQALLGFQFAAVLTQSFAGLPGSLQAAHLVSLFLVALAVVALMAPAAFHRLAEQGEETERVLRFSSAMVLASLALLAAGLAGDVFVVSARLVPAPLALALGGATLAGLLACWFAYPLSCRRGGPGRRRAAGTGQGGGFATKTPRRQA